MAEARPIPNDPVLAGWLEHNGRLMPDPTVAGAALRKVKVHGSCHIRQECRRSVDMDLAWLVERGYGGALLDEACDLYRCRRTPSCEMTWSGGPAEGTPLQVYVGRLVRFRIECRNCLAHSDHTAEAVIAGLQRSGQGDGGTGISVLAAKLTRACSACGQRSWKVDLRQPSRAAAGPAYPRLKRG